MAPRIIALSSAIILVMMPSVATGQTISDNPARWEPHIATFEKADRAEPPAPGGIVFIGSSSIRGWDLAGSFPDMPVINRGFGGSQLSDAVHFADRIVAPYRPKTVVLYAGDNDIAAGKSPDRVVEDFRRFVARIDAVLPQSRIVFIAIKPSLKRWELVGKMREANGRIKQLAAKDDRYGYVDIDTPMIGPDGRPRPELFKPDGLHLTEQGYRLWTDAVRPFLESGAR